jgi:hypothetical protein
MSLQRYSQVQSLYRHYFPSQKKVMMAVVWCICLILTPRLIVASATFPVAAGSSESWLRESFRKCPNNVDVSLVPSNTNVVTIDEGNAMIRVVNNSSGKQIVTVYRIFPGKEGVDMFAVQRMVGSGSSCDFRSQTHIYSFRDDTLWTDITFQIVPKLKLQDFYGKRGPKMPFDVGSVLSMTQEHSTAGDGLAIHYNLPLFGSRITARMIPQCSNKQQGVPPEYDTIFEKAEFSIVELVWSSEESKFEIDAKK